LYERDFWRNYPDARAADLAAFLSLARTGRPIEPFSAPPGEGRPKAEQEYQLAELDRSIRHCREVLGLGIKSQAT
jgi:hypothetical protein